MQYRCDDVKPSFLIKRCRDDVLDSVIESLRGWCITKGNSNTTMKIVIKDDNAIRDDNCRCIMYVNSLDLTLRIQAMAYVRKDLKTRFTMDMICKEQGNQDNLQFVLLIKTVEKPTMSEVSSLFKGYGGFDVMIKSDIATFINFWEYEDAKQAYNAICVYGVTLGRVNGNHPVMIQFTKMISHLHDYISGMKNGFEDADFMHIDQLKYFVTRC